MNKEAIYLELELISEKIYHYFTLMEADHEDRASDMILEIQKDIHKIQSKFVTKRKAKHEAKIIPIKKH